eukprot:gnl/Chilomastix_caulleri/3331.p1 GENE.gnl/Chilomastix_caulleri/3331~~gnl/Chilomastix_caulleri/3331.p1  ORF type:complete len:189 (+),score=19.11 gnl/Chilomastix_caulleri/3331:243-809(+)
MRCKYMSHAKTSRVSVVFTDVSIIQSTGKLYFSTMMCLTYCYFLKTGKIGSVPHQFKVWGFCSLSGINCGAQCIYQEAYSKRKTVCVHEDGTCSPIPLLLNESGVIAVFPSKSSPGDFTKALFKTLGGFVINYSHVSTPTFLSVDPFHSIVRVYDDIFITINRKTNKVGVGTNTCPVISTLTQTSQYP